MGETGLNHRQIHHILPSSGGWETKSADYLNNVNPAGTVPVLVHNGHPIYESHEQIVYIDQVLMPGGHSISKGSSRIYPKFSLLGVDSLWGDCTFIPADWGS